MAEHLSLRDAEKDDPLIRGALMEAIKADKQAGICHTIELLEKLTEAILRTKIPMLVTVDSFLAFWENGGPSGVIPTLAACTSHEQNRGDERYLSYLTVYFTTRL
jgi:hypothetical protein